MRLEPLKLPDLTETDCFYFEACGRLIGSKKREERSVQIARVRIKQQAAYLRLIRGGDNAPKGHLHVDLILTRYVAGKHPKINSTRAKISKEIARYYGKELDVVVFGQFITFIDDIPSGSGVVFAGPGAVVSMINNVAVEVGGAHLIFRNEGFVRTLDWQVFRKEREVVFTDILARTKIEASTLYLGNLFARLSIAFKTYVLGRSVDVTPTRE